ncbi:MAG: transporter permease, partial [Acidimicrobiales bacterium]|nr:transporter permease [Acidimicrobiales bacterium]
MIRAARLLNLRRIRQQPMRAVLAVLAVAGGVALGTSLLVVQESFSHSYAAFGRALGGPAPLRVVGATARGGLDDGVVDTVARTPGVAVAVPVVQAITYADAAEDPRRQVTVLALGVDCRIEAFVGSFGCSQEAIAGARESDPPLVSPSLIRRVGANGQLRTDAGRIALDGAPTSDRLQRTPNVASVAVFPLPVAQKLFARPHRLDAIYVKPAPGANLDRLKARLGAAVGGWNGVLASTDPPPGATTILGGFLPLFGMLAIFGIGVAVVLVYDTVALSIEERRRDLAVVAALGGEGRTVVGGTVAEAAVLGLAGGLLGAAGALPLGRSILASLSRFSERFTGVHLSVHAGATPFVVGAVLGTLIAGVAAWVPARRAMRMDVAAELSNRGLRDETAPALRLRRALLFTGVGVAALVVCWVAQRNGSLSKWQPPAGQLGVGVASGAFVVASGAFAPLVLALVLRARRRGRAPTRLGLANLVRDP